MDTNAAEYPFDTGQVPKGPMATPGITWPLGTRYLATDVNRCHFHYLCGVERAGLVTTLSDKQPKPTSTMTREGYWYTLCPEHYARADYLPRPCGGAG